MLEMLTTHCYRMMAVNLSVDGVQKEWLTKHIYFFFLCSGFWLPILIQIIWITQIVLFLLLFLNTMAQNGKLLHVFMPIINTLLLITLFQFHMKIGALGWMRCRGHFNVATIWFCFCLKKIELFLLVILICP